MKKYGFTLAELLAVIVVLGVLVLIIFPSVTKMLKNSKETAYQQQKNLIVSAARKWGLEHSNELDKYLDTFLSITDLKNNGYLAIKDVKDPRDDSMMNGCVVIRYSEDSNQYEYTYDEVHTCDEIRKWPLKAFIMRGQVTQGPGVYKISDTEYRFRGGCNIIGSYGNYSCSDADPVHNYISINGQKYRIIAMDSQGVKVMTQEVVVQKAYDERTSNKDGARNNADNTFCQVSSGNYYWGCNVYAAPIGGTFTAGSKTGTVTQNSSLYNYLNTSGTETAITTLRNAAKIVSWNIGAVARGSNVALSVIQSQEAAFKANFKLGLINVSDYIEGSLDASCIVDPISLSLISETCRNQNWLYLPHLHVPWNPWTINAWTGTGGNFEDSARVWMGSTFDGNLNSYWAHESRGVRPVGYLSSDIQVTGGTGTESDPWILIS